MVTKNISLGKNEVRLLFSLESKKISIFSFKDAKLILKTSNASVKNVIYRLKKKKRIKEIQKGRYLLAPAVSGLKAYWAEHPFIVANSILKEYYIGFWTALNYWGFTEQVPKTIFIAVKNRKRPFSYNKQKFKFITLNKKKFFGFTEKKISNTLFKVSSKEKTIIDCLMHPEYCGGIVEAAKAIKNNHKELDWNGLLKMLNKLDINVVRQRLGFILETLNIKKDILKKLMKKAKGFAWLDPVHPKKIINYSHKWQLKINVREEEIKGGY